MCVLLGYGADAICPYLVFEIARALRHEGVLEASYTDEVLYKVSHFITCPCLMFEIFSDSLPVSTSGNLTRSPPSLLPIVAPSNTMVS